VAKGDKSTQTRNLLLSAARNTLAEKGYHGTKVVDIIERAGVGHGTFYDYFKSKDDVLVALLEGFFADLYKMCESVSLLISRLAYDDFQGINIVITSFMEMFGRYSELHPVYRHAIWENEAVRSLFFGSLKYFSKLVADNIREMQKKGRCQNLDPDIVSQLIVVTIAFTNYTYQDGILEGDMHAISDNLSRVFFYALNYNPPEGEVI
jgi:AcrR family transcriptional regulator